MKKDNFISRLATLVAVQGVSAILGFALLLIYIYSQLSVALLIGGTALLLISVATCIVLLASLLRHHKARKKHVIRNNKSFSPQLKS
mgnify:CR=1 FL=1